MTKKELMELEKIINNIEYGNVTVKIQAKKIHLVEIMQQKKINK